MDNKLKQFTSQISCLPGPQSEVVQRLGDFYKEEKLELSKKKND
jgi:hypothetical protein